MCGLVAIISKQKQIGFTFQDKSIFQQMLIADMFRGMDSTGCFGVNAHGNLDMIKDTSAAPFLLNKKEANTKFFDNIISSYHIMVGHNRKATMGAVDSTNAHPFIEGDICLVHNGTLQNHRKLADATVDSHAVCLHMEKNGYKETIKAVEGAYAFIWYNAANKTVYFSRNAERPLFLVETTDRIYLASEGKMLDWLLYRNNITKYTVQNVPTDKIFKFSLDTRTLECESKPKKANPPVQQHTNWHTPGGTHQSQQNKQRHSTYGQLVLAHSSDTPAKASINTYYSGETIYWKITDWDIGTKTIKIMGETQDIYKTNIVFCAPVASIDSNTLTSFIDSPLLEGKVSSITSKRGHVYIYINNMKQLDRLVTANGKYISEEELDKAGAACYCCGTSVKTASEVFDATITTDKDGGILFISCSDCDSNALLRQGSYC